MTVSIGKLRDWKKEFLDTLDTLDNRSKHEHYATDRELAEWFVDKYLVYTTGEYRKTQKTHRDKQKRKKENQS